MRRGGRFDLVLEILAQRPGYLAFRATGRDANRAFAHEGGGHRWQRVPPTEKRGRVHTSTVTVAVLPEASPELVHLNDHDLMWKMTRSGGPGGQHANKTDSAVVLTHKPSGTRVRVESKSQHRNKESALRILRSRLLSRAQDRQDLQRNAERRKQVGGGARGDKRRTIALQRGRVVDHVTGKRITAKQFLQGIIEPLWPDDQ